MALEGETGTVATGKGNLYQLAQWLEMQPTNHRAVIATQPEVLILAARYGHGHMSAAKAIALDFLHRYPHIRMGLLDYYRFVNPRLDLTLRWAYMSSVRFAPRLWRWFYTRTQRIDPESTAQTWINHIGMDRFYEAIRPCPPRVIVSTYPTAAGVVSTLKQQGRLHVKNLVVMTDYSVHSQWIHPAVDTYFVGSEDVRDGLVIRGVDPRKIVVSGIPVDERFQHPVDYHRVRASLGVGQEPLVLFMGGDYMPSPQFLKSLKALDMVAFPHTTLVVAGSANSHRAEAENFARGARGRFVIKGFVNNVHELMGVAEVLVSKAGGLTTTEALCRGIPTVIYRPIPGQEDANAEFLVRHGAGVRARSEEELVKIVEDLLEHPRDLERMATQAQLLGHPEAAATVARAMEEAYQRSSDASA